MSTHFPAGGAAGGDLKGSYPNPRVRGEAANAQIADDVFCGRFPTNFAAPYVRGATFERKAFFTAGTSAIVTPTNDVMTPPMPFSGRIRQCTIVGLVASGVGSCQIDVRKCQLPTFPPTSAGSICNTHPPSVAGAIFVDLTESALAALGWSMQFSKGDMYVFSLASCSNFTAVEIILRLG